MSSVSSSAVEQFRGRVKGSVWTANEPGYDSARSAWNLSVQQHPALILAAADVHDITQAIQFAHEHGLGVAVQATGHGLARPADNALLILMREFQSVTIDPEARTARIEGGVKWGKVLEMAQAHGLAPLLGSSPDVGAVGYTLGGGAGWLARKYGLSADHVLSFEVVTAKGNVLNVSDTQNSDLFWALRGGGGNYAIVTAMTVRLFPVQQVYAGNLLYPASQAREVFQHYREWIVNLPEEVSSGVLIMNYPPFDFLPEAIRGRSFAILRGCHTGSMVAGEAMIDAWRAWRKPALDLFEPMSFAAAETISQDPAGPIAGYSTGANLADLSDETIDLLLQYSLPHGGPPPVVKIEVRHAGGAVLQAQREAEAVSYREQTLLLNLVTMTPTPEAFEQAQNHAQALWSALGTHLTSAIYPNFLDGAEQVERVNDLFEPDKHSRLQAVKATYDPDNLLRFGFGVPR